MLESEFKLRSRYSKDHVLFIFPLSFPVWSGTGKEPKFLKNQSSRSQGIHSHIRKRYMARKRQKDSHRYEVIHCGAETQGMSWHPLWAPGVLSVLQAEALGFPSRLLPEDMPFPLVISMKARQGIWVSGGENVSQER